MSEVEQWKKKILLTVSLNIKIIIMKNFFMKQFFFFLNSNTVQVDLFKKEELISFWIKLIKVIIFTFIVEIIFLLRLCHMFEHIYFFLPSQF